MTNIKLRDFLLLATLPLLYALTVVHDLWTLPPPSDPLDYAGLLAWGSTVGYFPNLDRLNLMTGLKLFNFLPGPAYLTATLYALTVSISTIAAGQLWLYRSVGFGAALTFGVFANSSWFFLFFGSQVLPEPTLVLFSALAVISYLWSEDKNSLQALFVASLFATMACFCKVTAYFLPVLMLFFVWRKHGFKKQLAVYLSGSAVGTVITVGLFALTWGSASLLDTIEQFFGSNLSANYVGRAQFNNAVSYFDVITSRSYLPLFLGLIVSVGAYHHKQAKRILPFAWSFVLSLYFIYLVTNRGYTPIPNYIYPGYYFTALALAAYFGGSFSLSSQRTKTKAVLLSLLLLSLGWSYGKAHNPNLAFDSGSHPDLTTTSALFFNGGLLLSFALMLLFERKRHRFIAPAFVLTTALWSSAFSGGRVYHHFAKVLIPEQEFYYHYAGTLNLPTSKSVDVFVERWLTESESPERIKWVYRLFFDQRYDRSKGQKFNDQEISENIQIMKEQTELSSGHGEQILTDRPDIVQKLIPTAKVISQTDWTGVILTVLAR